MLLTVWQFGNRVLWCCHVGKRGNKTLAKLRPVAEHYRAAAGDDTSPSSTITVSVYGGNLAARPTHPGTIAPAFIAGRVVKVWIIRTEMNQ
jgi:hypothetical protein